MNVAGFECLLVKDATDGYVGQDRKAIVADMITLSQVIFPNNRTYPPDL